MASDPVAQYDYGIAIKGRFVEDDGRKTFRWRMKESLDWNGLKGIKEVDLPLYGYVDSPTVFVCEGEKAVDACLTHEVAACCLPGGASAKTFGSALQPLEGKRVILWPDNDDVGRGLMRRIAAALNGSTETVFVNPKVPPSGDAFDYFDSGGSVDALLHEADGAVAQPTVTETEDGYIIAIPDMGGVVTFEFSEPLEKMHDLTADLSVEQMIPGMKREKFTSRLNILSMSAREGYRRALDEIYEGSPKGYWTRLLTQACMMFRDAHKHRDWSIDLEPVEAHTQSRYLIHPILPDDGHTIWFGQGQSGKTYLALATAVSVALGSDDMNYYGEAAAVLFVDYESGEKIIKRRIERIMRGMNRTAPPDFYRQRFIYWPGRGPLATSMPALLRRVQGGVRLVVIDSAGLASGGNPKDEDVALNYFNALKKLGVPCLTLAHQTKDADADQYPYGSIFWSTSARSTWNVKGAEEAVDGVKHSGLYHRKGNEDVMHQPVGFSIEFGEDYTKVERESLFSELTEHLGIRYRIRSILSDGKRMTAKEIAKELGVKVDTAYRNLKRIPNVLYEGGRGQDTEWFIATTE